MVVSSSEGVGADIDHSDDYAITMSDHKPTRKWYQIQWFSPDDTKEERRLIWKLDLLIVPYVFLSYWTKYIDQANISQYSCHLCKTQDV
jgi:hypothetical protein